MRQYQANSSGKPRHLKVMALLSSAVVCAATWTQANDAIAHPSSIDRPEDAGFDVQLTGRIKDNCQLKGGGTLALGEIVGQKTVNAGFDLNCNVPFAVDVTSLRGGLAHATHPQGEGPFAGTATYRLNLYIPTLSPTPSTLHAAFDSTQLRSGTSVSSGEAIAAGGGRIEVKLNEVIGAGLLAGDYSESLIITVSQRL